MTIEDTLRRSELFLGLDNNELKMIADLPSTGQVTCLSGHFLFKAGDKATNIYVLEEGQIDIVAETFVGDEKKSVTVDIITKGGLVGWSALIRPNSYVLSAICETGCRMTAISGKELLDLFELQHQIGHKVFQGLSHIIGSSYRDLQQVLIKGKRWPFIEKHAST